MSLSATDLLQFSDEDFDIKAWINRACAPQPDDESLDRCLSDLEMRVHLAAEDVEAKLEAESSKALQRIPAAVQELALVRGDVLALRQDLLHATRMLGASSQAAGANVAALIALDRVKSRMEAACSTLKEATELSALFARVEAVFAGGDLPRISATLAAIRRSLALVGNVPEFQGGLVRLQALEERFQALLDPALGAAFAARAGERVAGLLALLGGPGRDAGVDRLYCAARLPPLQRHWDAYEGRGFAAWLPSFYGAVGAAAADEAHWAAGVLPDDHPRLLLRLLPALFARIDKPFRTRLAAALTAVSEEGGDALEAVAELQGAAAGFVAGLAENLPGLSAGELRGIALAAHAPFEAYVLRYGELEEPRLRAAMAGIPVAEAGDDMEAILSSLAGAGAAAAKQAQAAVQRCLRVTGGTALPTLAAALDPLLTGLIARMHAAMQALRAAGGEPSAAPLVSEDGLAVLPLLNVAGALSSHLGACEAAFREATAQLGAALGRVEGLASVQALDPMSLRLLDEEGRLLGELRGWVAGAEAHEFVALPTAAARGEAFAHAAHSAVYNALMAKVRTELGGLAAAPVWEAEPEASSTGGGVALPAFSAYPQPGVTAAGEYLMMLPQTLEAALAGGPGAGAWPEGEDAAVDAEWLDRVVGGAGELLLGELERIGRLSARGAAQLAADLEYFCNVLSALGVALPPALATWQVAAGWSDEDFTAAAGRALEDGAIDRSLLEPVARARQLPLPNA